MNRPLVFLSYRRLDNEHGIADIDAALSARFGEARVFRDIDHLRAGDNFEIGLLNAVRAASVVVAIIGPRWIDGGNPERPRLFEPDDYVRRELSEALRRSKAIVPLLVGGAPMPGAGALPDDLAPLHTYQALEITTASRDTALDALCTRVESLLRQDRYAPDGTPLTLSAVDYFEVVLPTILRIEGPWAAQLAASVERTLQVKVTGEGGGTWAIVMDASGPRVVAGGVSEPDTEWELDGSAFTDMQRGKLDARAAIARGGVVVRGDISLLKIAAQVLFGESDATAVRPKQPARGRPADESETAKNRPLEPWKLALYAAWIGYSKGEQRPTVAELGRMLMHAPLRARLEALCPGPWWEGLHGQALSMHAHDNITAMLVELEGALNGSE